MILIQNKVVLEYMLSKLLKFFILILYKWVFTHVLNSQYLQIKKLNSFFMIKILIIIKEL
jgi:hypothetical protein